MLLIYIILGIFLISSISLIIYFVFKSNCKCPPPSPSGCPPSPSGCPPCPSGCPPCPSGGVPSPSGGVPSPSGGVPSPSGGVPSPSGGVPSPSGDVPSPSGGVPSPSGAPVTPGKYNIPASFPKAVDKNSENNFIGNGQVYIVKNQDDLNKIAQDFNDIGQMTYQAADYTIKPKTILLYPNSENYNFNNIKLFYYTSIYGIGDKDKIIIENTNNLLSSTPWHINSIDNVFFISIKNCTIDDDLHWFTSQGCPLRNLTINKDFDTGGHSPGFISDSTVKKNIISAAGYGSGTQQYLFKNVTCNGTTPDRTQYGFSYLNCTIPSIKLNEKNKYTCQKLLNKNTLIQDKNQKQDYSRAPDIEFTDPDIRDYNCPILKEEGVYFKNKFFKTIYFISGNIDNKLQNLQENTAYVISPGIYEISSFSVPIGSIIIGLGFCIFKSRLNTLNYLFSQDDSFNFITLNESSTIYNLIIDAPDYTTIPCDSLINVLGNNCELYDIFCRTVVDPNNQIKRLTRSMLTVNGLKCYIEHAWLWRGDHASNGKGFDKADYDVNNINIYGLVVNQQNCTSVGIFAEHQLYSSIVWNGDNGKLYFSQGEMAYTNFNNKDKDICNLQICNPIKDIDNEVIGSYMSITSKVNKFLYNGGNIYSQFNNGDGHERCAIAIYQNNKENLLNDNIKFKNTLCSCWVNHGDGLGFNYLIKFIFKDKQPEKCGPKLYNNNLYIICDLKEFVKDTTPPPAPPKCKSIQCSINSKADYSGNLSKNAWDIKKRSSPYTSLSQCMDDLRSLDLIKQGQVGYLDGSGYNCKVILDEFDQSEFKTTFNSYQSGKSSYGFNDESCCKFKTGPSNINACS